MKRLFDIFLLVIELKRATRSRILSFSLAFFVGIIPNISPADPTVNEEILNTLKETLYGLTYDSQGNEIYYPVLSSFKSEFYDFMTSTGATGARGMTASQYLDILQHLGIVEMVEDTSYDPPLYYLEVKDYEALDGVYTNEYFLTQMSANMSKNTLYELLSNGLYGAGDFTIGAFSLLGFAFPKFLEGIDVLKNGLAASNDYTQLLRKMDEIISTLKACCTNKNQDIQIQILEWMTNNWDRAEFAPPDDGGTNSVNDSTNDFSLGVRFVDLLGGETPAIEWISEYDENLNLTRRPVWSSPEFQPQEQYLHALADLQEQAETDSIGFGEVVTSLLQIQSYIQCDILTAHKILYDALFSGTNDITEVSELQQLKTQVDDKTRELFSDIEYQIGDVDLSGELSVWQGLKNMFSRSFTPSVENVGVVTLSFSKFMPESASDILTISIDTNTEGWHSFITMFRFASKVIWVVLLWLLLRQVVFFVLFFFFRSIQWCVSIFGFEFKPLDLLCDFFKAFTK